MSSRQVDFADKSFADSLIRLKDLYGEAPEFFEDLYWEIKEVVVDRLLGLDLRSPPPELEEAEEGGAKPLVSQHGSGESFVQARVPSFGLIELRENRGLPRLRRSNPVPPRSEDLRRDSGEGDDHTDPVDAG